MTGSVFALRPAIALVVLAATAAFAQPTDATPFAIAIKDGTVPREQRVLRVLHESPVRIVWSSDRVMTVHLEGYDISVTVRPGVSTVMAFKAFASGRFSVHAKSAHWDVAAGKRKCDTTNRSSAGTHSWLKWSCNFDA